MTVARYPRLHRSTACDCGIRCLALTEQPIKNGKFREREHCGGGRAGKEALTGRRTFLRTITRRGSRSGQETGFKATRSWI
jgi:hypothetical protein